MAATMTPVQKLKEFFGMSAQEFMKDWKLLSDDDKRDLKDGIENGTLTY